MNFKRAALFGLVTLMAGAANAVSTINIEDPSITDTLFTGTSSYHGGKLGTSVVAGDFNNDGVDDLAMGAPGMSSPRAALEAGLVFIYFGGVGSGIDTLPPQVSTAADLQDVLLYGANADERAGELLAAGDLNGDDIDDLVIVAQHGDINLHKIYVVYGNATLGTTDQISLANANVVITRSRTHAFSTWPSFTVSAITVADLDNDTKDDLILSDQVNNQFNVLLGPFARPPVGQTVLSLDLSLDSDITYVHGSALDLLPGIGDPIYFPAFNGDEIAGVAVGDMNGDSKNDLVMGLPNETAGGVTESGRLYLIPGTGSNFVPSVPPVAINTLPGITRIEGALPYDEIGGPLVMGNLNGDNYDDLLIGQPRSMQGQVSSTGYGQAQVLLGRATLPPTLDLFFVADSTLRISRKADEAGLSTIGFYTGTSVLASDVNGDNLDDIIISSPGASFTANHGHGWVHTVYGRAVFSDEYLLEQDANQWILTPEPTNALASGYFGASMTAADFNGDQKLDMAVGAPTGYAFGTVNSGYVPLLLSTTLKVGCSGDNPVVEDSFLANPVPYVCEGIVTLMTNGNVAVSSGATVEFYSPAITLSAGFGVATGGVFKANATM